MAIILLFSYFCFSRTPNSDNVSDGVGSTVFPFSAFHAEALALKCGLQMVESWCFFQLLVESDCQDLITAVSTSSTNYDWRCLAIVDGIKSISQQFDFCTLSWIHRSSDMAAHWVTSNAAEKMCPVGWIIGFLHLHLRWLSFSIKMLIRILLMFSDHRVSSGCASLLLYFCIFSFFSFHVYMYSRLIFLMEY